MIPSRGQSKSRPFYLILVILYWFFKFTHSFLVKSTVLKTDSAYVLSVLLIDHYDPA